MPKSARWLPAFKKKDLHAIVALLYCAIALTAMEFWLLPTRVEARLRGLAPHHRPSPGLEAGLEWAFGCVVLYLVVPLLLIVIVHRQAPSEFGFRARGFLKHLWVYLLCYVVMVPALWWVAEQPRFLQTYPFVAEARTDLGVFVRWELAYLAQFVALEAFFRGYLLFALNKSLGPVALFVMAVPYCMIHYHKPPAEAFGAILAGLFLGALALRFRSWLGGAIPHMLVALSMDGLSAWRAGLFAGG